MNCEGDEDGSKVVGEVFGVRLFLDVDGFGGGGGIEPVREAFKMAANGLLLLTRAAGNLEALTTLVRGGWAVVNDGFGADSGSL